MAKPKAKPASSAPPDVKPPFVAEEPTPAWPRATHPEMPLTEAEKDAIDWEIIKNDDENDSIDAREALAMLRAERAKREKALLATRSRSPSKASKTRKG